MKKIILLILFCIVSIFACSCRTTVETPNYVFEVEQTVELNIYDEDRKILVNSTNLNENVTFECDNDVITVLSDGTIIANKFGQTNVKVVCGSQEKVCVVTVLSTEAIPVISLSNIQEDNFNLNVGDMFPLDYMVSVEGYTFNGDCTFATSNSSVLEVTTDGLLTAKQEGSAVLTVSCAYKLWEVERVLNVNVCADSVVKLSKNRISLTTVSGIVGYDIEKAIEFLGLYEDGVKTDGATVTWESMDTSVATVSNGVITAVNNGKTYVKAVCNNGEKTAEGYVLVTVAYPQLEKPANFSLEGDTLVWDSLENANGYVVFDSMGNEISVTANTVLLSELNPANNYFSEQKFYVYGYSDNEYIENSSYAVCTATFRTLSYVDKIAKQKDKMEANIQTYDGADFVADTPIYYASCTSRELPGRSDVYGYLFRKVFYTNKAYQIYGANGSHGTWCNTSLLNPAVESNFYNAKMSFWAYAETETTIYYVKMDQNWNREIIYKQVIPAETWTQFSCSISKEDFPFLTMLSASGDFYFADFRISELSYELKNYSDIDKGAERVEEINSLIAALPVESQITNTVEFGDSLRVIRDKYEQLSSKRKAQVHNYDKLVATESAYGGLVYDAIKNDVNVTSLVAMIGEYNDGYAGVTMDVVNSLEKKAKEINSKFNVLPSNQYYGVWYENEEYEKYLSLRKEYKLIDIATTNVSEMIISTSYPMRDDAGFAGIDNMFTAPNVATALNHPVYGYCATMGTNARHGSAISFRTKGDWELTSYTHIMFAVKNPRDEKMSVYLFDGNGRGKVLASNIAKADNHGEYATVIVSVDDFMNNDICFGYDTKVTSQANIWLTNLVAIKVDETVLETISELQVLLETLKSGVTMESVETIAKARRIYDSLTSEQKLFVSNATALTEAEETYAVLDVEDKISKIGNVTATEECLNKIKSARTAYNQLSIMQQNRVSNYNTLLAAEETIRQIAAPNESTRALIDSIQTFLDGFTGVTPQNFWSVQETVADLDVSIAELDALQLYAITNYEAYMEAKTSFKLIDDISGADIASRFKFSAGSNGINNGVTAPNIATALKDTTYGPCATIGKNSQGLTVRYTNTEALDLSGYTHVTFAIKNSLNTKVTVKTTSTERVLAEGVAYGTFATITMTVEEFLSEGFAIYTNVQGSVWISAIIAVKA